MIQNRRFSVRFAFTRVFHKQCTSITVPKLTIEFFVPSLLFSSGYKSIKSYFIPEDGDEEMCPNVFLAPKPRQPGTPPTLGQVKDSFPLPGRYHFRFKSPLLPGGDREKGAMAVWMDTVTDNLPVPTWQNTIVAKVTRISAEEEDSDDDDMDHGRSSSSGSAPPTRAVPPPRAPPSHSTSMHSSSSADHLDIFDSAPPAQAAPQPMPHSAPPSTANLFDTHHHAPAPATSSGSSLFDMDGGFGHAAPAASSVHNDFLGMTAPPMATPSRPPPQQQGGYPGSTPAHNPYGQPAPTPQTIPRPPQAPLSGGANVFDGFSNQQGPFGGLGTPWK
jgi:hypothetical protein